MEIGNYSQRPGQLLEPSANLNACMEYLQPLRDIHNFTPTLPTLEVPAITGTTPIVAAFCLAVCILILTLKLGLACMRRQPSHPGPSSNFIPALLTPLAAVGCIALLLCTQYFMEGTGGQLYIPATFLWTWCRHTFFFVITSMNLSHINTLHQPFNLSSAPPLTILTKLTTLLTAFMLLVLGAGLSIPSVMRALHTPPCGWAAMVQSYIYFDSSAEVWVVWLDSVASVLSLLSALALVKRVIGILKKNSLEAAEHKWMLSWLLIEGVSTAVLTASLGLPATLIALYAPLSSMSSETNFLWLMALESILQTVYYAAIASISFVSHSLAENKNWLCHCPKVGDRGEFCNCWQSSRDEPEEPMAEASPTHPAPQLVAEYVAMGSSEPEDEGGDSFSEKRKDTCVTISADSESLFSINVNMPQSSVKENFRRKTFFDRPSMVSRAVNPTPQHGRSSNVSLAGYSIKSYVSSTDKFW